MAQRTQLKQLIELGVSHRQMNDHLLHDAVVALAQEAARARVVAANVTALTDSSGGTAQDSNGAFVLSAVVTPTKGTVDGATAFSPKAGFDTATAAIDDAHGEIATKLGSLLEAVSGSAGVGILGTFGGTAGGTIAAITAALTAATSGCVAAASGISEITKLRNTQAALASALNYVRVAMGLNTIVDGSGGVFTRDVTGWDVTDFERAATATAATSGQETLTDATVDAALGALKNNVATLAAALAEVVDDSWSIGPFVVATSNARTRLINTTVETGAIS